MLGVKIEDIWQKGGSWAGIFINIHSMQVWNQ